jgi:hypothetical protein
VRIERSVHSDLSAEQVYQMSTSRQFQEQKCRDAGALSFDVSISEGDGGAVVRTKRTLPTTAFPGMLRKVVPSGITATETVVWGHGATGGGRTARLDVAFHNAPVSLKGTIRVLPGGPNAATVLVDAEFRAHVPIIGGTVERAALPIVIAIIEAEETTGRAWAAAG